MVAVINSPYLHIHHIYSTYSPLLFTISIIMVAVGIHPTSTLWRSLIHLIYINHRRYSPYLHGHFVIHSIYMIAVYIHPIFALVIHCIYIIQCRYSPYRHGRCRNSPFICMVTHAVAHFFK